jgi:hypothetical protein
LSIRGGSKMNKKQKPFSILGIISLLIGSAMVFVCSLNEKIDIQLSITEKIIVGTVGVIFVIGAIACLLLFLNDFFNRDENSRIEENDERNIMIRGKAAGISMLITIFAMLIVEFILICIGDLKAASLVAIVMFLCGFVQILLIGYYQRKY